VYVELRRNVKIYLDGKSNGHSWFWIDSIQGRSEYLPELFRSRFYAHNLDPLGCRAFLRGFPGLRKKIRIAPRAPGLPGTRAR